MNFFFKNREWKRNRWIRRAAQKLWKGGKQGFSCKSIVQIFLLRKEVIICFLWGSTIKYDQDVYTIYNLLPHIEALSYHYHLLYDSYTPWKIQKVQLLLLLTCITEYFIASFTPHFNEGVVWQTSAVWAFFVLSQIFILCVTPSMLGSLPTTLKLLSWYGERFFLLTKNKEG